jgi:hypothetical protein
MNNNDLDFPVRVSVVQRDNRTSLNLKKAYVWIPALTGLCAFALTGIVIYNRERHDMSCDGDQVLSDLTLYLSYVAIALCVILVIINFSAVFNPKFMWMTSTFDREKWLGEDIEDTNPHILASKGHEIARKVEEDTRELDRMVGEFSLQVEDQDQYQNWEELNQTYDLGLTLVSPSDIEYPEAVKKA